MRTKNIIRVMVSVLIVLGLTITACDKRSDVTRESLTFEGINTEQMLGGEGTEELNRLFGNLTFGEILELLGNSLKSLNALADQGYTTKEDYQTLLNIIKNVHTYLLEEKKSYEADPEAYNAKAEADAKSSEAMSELLKMAVDAKVGVLLNQVMKQAGQQSVTQNIYPMIAYVLDADEDILKNAISFGTGSTPAEKLTQEEFNSLIDFANKIVDSDREYKEIHDAITRFRQALDDEQNPVTIDDVEALMESLDVLAGPYSSTNPPDEEEPPAGPYTSEQSKQIWEDALDVIRVSWENDLALRNDASEISDSLTTFMISSNLDSLLSGFVNVLSTPQVDLKAFVTKALAGLASSSGSEAMSELLPYLASVDRNDIPGIADGLNAAFTCNMYGQDRSAATVKISELRALMYMMQEAHSPNNVLNKLGIIKLMSSPDDKEIVKFVPGFKATSTYTTNVAEWTIGEVVTAIQYFKATGQGDAIDALNWVLYKKKYNLIGFSILGVDFAAVKYEGQVGMMTDDMMKLFRDDNIISLSKLLGAEGVDGIIDPFPAFVELAGGKRDGSDTAWKNSDNAIGERRHSLFALFAPLMQSAWENDIREGNMKRTYGTVDMLAQLNEISHSSYVSLNYPKPNDPRKPTFVEDNVGTIVKSLEAALDPALRGSGPGFLMPVLDLALTMARNLYNTPSPVAGESLLTSMVMDLNMQPSTSKTQGETITKLFVDLDADGHNLITNALAMLNPRNRATIVNFANVMGNAMDESGLVATMIDLSDSLLEDYDTLSPIISKLIPDSGSDEDDDDSTAKELMDYLTAKINGGQDENPFIKNGKTLLYRVLDIQDNIYNPAGYISGASPITGPGSLLNHISELYSVKEWIFFDEEPVITFLKKATIIPEDKDHPLWTIYSAESSGMLDKIMGNDAGPGYTEISIRTGFIKAIFTDVDNNGDGIKEEAVAYSIMKQINLSYAENDREFMQRILEELYELTSGNEPSPFKPGSESFDNLILTLENLLDSIVVY